MLLLYVREVTFEDVDLENCNRLYSSCWMREERREMRDVSRKEGGKNKRSVSRYLIMGIGRRCADGVGEELIERGETKIGEGGDMIV